MCARLDVASGWVGGWGHVSVIAASLSSVADLVSMVPNPTPPHSKPCPTPAVSRSEAGQAKALLVLDASQGWRVCEELPLDLGPRHFEAESEEELQALAGALRRGDRCGAVWCCSFCRGAAPGRRVWCGAVWCCSGCAVVVAASSAPGCEAACSRSCPVRAVGPALPAAGCGSRCQPTTPRLRRRPSRSSTSRVRSELVPVEYATWCSVV